MRETENKCYDIVFFQCLIDLSEIIAFKAGSEERNLQDYHFRKIFDFASLTWIRHKLVVNQKTNPQW